MILQAAKEAIIAVDKNGLISSFNPGAEKIFDQHSKDWIGRHFSELLEDQENQLTLNRLSKSYQIPFKDIFNYLTFAAKRNIRNEIPLAYSIDNQKKYVVFSVSTLADKNGQLTGYLLEGTDITERRTWEEELKIAHLKAEAGNMAKSQFLANMSHDLRTPLTAILGFNELLKMKSKNLTETEMGYLNRIQDNGQLLLKLIESILDLERIEVGKIKIEKEEILLDQLLQKIIDQLGSQFISKHITPILDCPPNLEPINTDPEKLTQILINLIGNSLKFTHQGTLKITVHKEEETNIARSIDISDTGVGMNNEELTKIFDAFYQVRGPGNMRNPGSGLGLAIVKSLCDLLDYTITVKSEPGKGSTFTIHLV